MWLEENIKIEKSTWASFGEKVVEMKEKLKVKYNAGFLLMNLKLKGTESKVSIIFFKYKKLPLFPNVSGKGFHINHHI